MFEFGTGAVDGSSPCVPEATTTSAVAVVELDGGANGLPEFGWEAPGLSQGFNGLSGVHTKRGRKN